MIIGWSTRVIFYVPLRVYIMDNGTDRFDRKRGKTRDRFPIRRSRFSSKERKPAYLIICTGCMEDRMEFKPNKPLMIVHFLFFCRCVAGMAEKLREAAARGDVARVARLLDEDIKPLPDEVSFLFSLLFNIFLRLSTIFYLESFSRYLSFAGE